MIAADIHNLQYWILGRVNMNITSTTHIKETYTTHLGFGINARFIDIESELSKTMTNTLIKYALSRLDEDLRELVVNKNYRAVIERTVNDSRETLNDSDYQVNFVNERGLMISVDYILLKNYKPTLDHGVSLAEGQ